MRRRGKKKNNKKWAKKKDQRSWLKRTTSSAASLPTHRVAGRVPIIQIGPDKLVTTITLKARDMGMVLDLKIHDGRTVAITVPAECIPGDVLEIRGNRLTGLIIRVNRNVKNGKN